MLNWLSNWWNDRKYEQGKFYSLVADEQRPDLPLVIRINQGKFRGVKYAYTTVKLDSGSYSVLPLDAESHKRIDAGGMVWEDISAKVLVNVIRNMWDNNAMQIGLKPGEEYEDDREVGVEESVAERTVRPKGSSLPE